jgi:allantoin racemase
MRIKYIVPFAWGPEGVAKRDALIPRQSLSQGTVVDTVSVRAHPAPGGSLVSYYESALMDVYMIDAAVSAEDEGYDAVVMDTTSDSGIYAIRSRLSIPVVGPSMVSYAIAALLGLRFAIVCYSEAHRRFYETKLEFYKMSDRCVSVRAAGVVPDYESLFGAGADEEFDRLTETASAAIDEDGAEVIVLGSTTMVQAQAHMAARLSAPVISPGPVAIKLAESLVALGLSHSKLSFPSPETVEDDVWARLATKPS